MTQRTLSALLAATLGIGIAGTAGAQQQPAANPDLQKQNLQDAIDKVADVTNNLNFIKTKVEADDKSLDDRIKSGLSSVGKSGPTSR